MNSDVKLSTRFVQATGDHQVGLLLTVGADAPPTRPPINVALVLDRSGSMAGEPLEAARDAACRFAGFLGPNDRISVVAFDDQVLTVVPPSPGGDPSVPLIIRSIESGGQTNLSGGWLKGHELAESARVEGVNRVVLLTDGQANAGITEPSRLADLARGAAGKGVGTSCFGFGPAFNLELLQLMAAGGRGNYWYIETNDQMTPVFEEEIEGLVALAAQNLEVELRLLHPGASGVTFLQDYAVTRTAAGGYLLSLGDLYATAARQVGVRLHVEHPEALGAAPLAEIVVRADVIRADGIERTTVTIPVAANLDGADHGEPQVETSLLRFEAAQARAEAVRHADAQDFDGARHVLECAAASLRPFASDPAIAEEVGDLLTSAARLDERKFGEDDRRYHSARARGVFDQKAAYLAKIARTQHGTPKQKGQAG